MFVVFGIVDTICLLISYETYVKCTENNIITLKNK